MKKLGSQLTTGDVVVNLMPMGEPERRVVLATHYDVAGSIFVIYARGDIRQPERTNHFHCMSNDEFAVEDRGGVTADELTMLVEAADQLVKLHDSGDAGPSLLIPPYRAALGALVARLAPAVAPTLDEVLRALDGVDPDHMPPSAKRVIEQARRAGML